MDKNEALQVIRSNFPTGRHQLCEALETLIPELKKSDDEKIRKELKSFFDSEMSDYGNVEWRKGIRYGEIVAWLEKQGEQKPTWSEEDEKYYDSALWHIKNSCGIEGNIYNWLKSLKERMKGECISVTDEELAQAKKDAYNDALDKIEYHSGEPTFDDGWSAAIEYLKKKNTQPQNTWKPSDEQMEALYTYIYNPQYFNSPDPRMELVESVYKDLKKLKEEWL